MLGCGVNVPEDPMQAESLVEAGAPGIIMQNTGHVLGCLRCVRKSKACTGSLNSRHGRSLRLLPQQYPRPPDRRMLGRYGVPQWRARQSLAWLGHPGPQYL